MWKAYDTFLHSEVYADKAGGSEQYRYECVHCREEVRLAAGQIIDAHFRHLPGNNDIDCENYLGQYGIINGVTSSRRSKNERAEFYFRNNTKLFYLGLRFNDDEINIYEQKSTTVELSTSTHGRAFFNRQINKINFQPDILEEIPLEEFSYNYFLSNTLNSVKRKYEVFKYDHRSDVPTFFKKQIDGDDFKAKLVCSPIVYTDVQYFMTYPNPQSSLQSLNFPNGINIEKTFGFKTMNRNFIGVILTITEKTPRIDSILNSWGYQLEPSETLALLWPPAVIDNDTALINASSYAYLYSTFDFQAHGNINIYQDKIKKISDRILRVSLKTDINIFKKNTELAIRKHTYSPKEFDELQVSEKYETTFCIPDDNGYFLFNQYGVIPKNKGAFIWLTPSGVIRHYMFGYLCERILPTKQSILSGERLLNDILIHYKRMEAFVWDDFDSLDLSSIAYQYIESCEKTGLINAAAKRFIEEGQV